MGTIVLLAIFMATAMTRATVGLDVSSRDVAAKRAVQTARAGIRVAVYRANGLGVDLNQLLSPSQQCIINTGNVLDLVDGSTTNWCTIQTEDLGTGASFTYRVSPVLTTVVSSGCTGLLGGTCTYLLERQIVASGTVDGVTRRVHAKMSASGSKGVTRVCVLVCVNLVSSGSLQIYRIEPGSFRECSPTPVSSTASDPSAGC